MKKVFCCLFIFSIALLAKVDYSVVSTEELMAMVGYVPAENKSAFLREVNARIRTMSDQEKHVYQHNIKKLKKVKK
ncbi:DUF1104 domain-containing protein [Sulfurospirillum sp. 1612]|uniref:DUF1104 domain-containing protein n=1 Tax=Sulfurospirillum sp. 1612 TaxID=3094835 RepID=UPI002F92773E